MITITAWLLIAINAWGASPVPLAERDTVTETRRRVAEDVAAVAYDAAEPPLYSGPYARALTAINITSIASLESRFSARIIRGNCRRHECDNGKATGMMQVHLGKYGLRLLPNGKAEACSTFAADCLDKADLVADESLQIRAGLHILRTQGFGAFTRANDARAQATEWLAKHPPPMTDAQAMAAGVAESQR